MKVVSKKGLLGLLAVFVLTLGMTVNAAGLNSGFATSATAYAVNAATLHFSATLPSVPASDDGLVYLYELQCFEYSIPVTAVPVGQAVAGVTADFDVPLNFGQPDTKLYSKFVLAVKVAGVPTMISNPQYISNPEILATHTKARVAHNYIEDQTYDNTNLVLTGSPSSAVASSIKRSVVILNKNLNANLANAYSLLPETHPLDELKYYMLNCNTPAGVKTVAEELAFYAANSNGEEWMVGNEVNARKWNYIAWTSWDEYMRQYEQVFRVCYNAIKSQNANAKVYINIEQCWDRNIPASSPLYYDGIDGKDMLAAFAADMKAGGDIDWSLAIHPYTVPLTYAKFWDMSGLNPIYKQQLDGNKMVSFQNMSVITNYMMTAPMLYKGNLRTVYVNELGVERAQGDEVQAATLYASYYACKNNPMISGINFLHIDGGGVTHEFGPKAMEIFQAMRAGDASAYDGWAKAVIGISDWSQVIK